VRIFTHYPSFHQQVPRFFSALVLVILATTGIKAQASFAAGCYSLRKMSASYSGNAIQVRRCDGATGNVGFNSCGGLDTVALKNFVLAGTPLSSMSTSSAAAYSLRKLNCSYSGNAIQVRRSSDNTTQNIGFTTSGDLDTAAMKTFVGANSAFVTTWYDQSGNGRNATQATAANQPRIMNAGTIHRQNSRPAVFFSGPFYLTSTLTGVTASTTGNITTANMVFQSSTGVAGTILSNGDGGTNRYNIHSAWSDNNTYFDIGNIGTGGRINTGLTWTSLSIGTLMRNGSLGEIWKNGASVYTNSMSSTVTSTAALDIGGEPAYGSYMTGYMAELIVFPSALSTTDRRFLEWAQSQYYAVGSLTLGTLPANPPNATVATWYDQSGNSRNMTQTTASQQPTILSAGYITHLANGFPAMVGSTSAQTCLTGNLAAAYTGSNLTAMTVIQADEFSAQNRRIMSFSTGTASADWTSANHFNVNQRGTNGDQFAIERSGVNPFTSAFSLSTPFTHSTQFNGTNRLFYVSGTASGTQADASNFSFTHFRVLHSINPGFEAIEGFTGKIAEFTWMQSAGNARRIIMESAQAAYYGLTVSNIVYTPPAPGTYNQFVTGIYRVSATDTVLGTRGSAGGMGLTSTTGTFLRDNGDRILIGTECLLSTTSAANITAPVVARWANDWYIDKNDAAGTTGGNVTIYFDFSDYGISITPGTAADYRLLTRASSSGTFTAMGTAATVSGDRVSFTLSATAANIPDGNYFTLGSVNLTTAPLPVELTTFEGTTCSSSVCLHWETASELNNDHFSVGRSADAMDFEAIGKVDSKAINGNSNEQLTYVFKDAAPLSGTSYYQLTQYDQNGQSKKSKIISVNFDASHHVSFVVYPNPNQGEFSVDFSGLENNHELTVSMMDLQGKNVYHHVIDMQTLSSNTFKIIPDTKILSGTYLVVFEVQGIKYTSKVIVE
jgi:hypothetical protein